MKICFGSPNQPLLPRPFVPNTAASVCGVAADLGTINNEPSIVIGERWAWNDWQPFGISPADHRHHVYIIGKTGSGKTTLLRNLLIQHIEMGHRVGLIDPHGDLAEDLLSSVPSWRADHLAYFNPSDLEHPIAMNLFADVPPDDRHLIASGIVGACKNLWRESWGPRLEYILYNAIAALLECQNTSLLGVNRMLTDESYRAWIVRQIEDPFIREFWVNEYASYDARFQRADSEQTWPVPFESGHSKYPRPSEMQSGHSVYDE